MLSIISLQIADLLGVPAHGKQTLINK